MALFRCDACPGLSWNTHRLFVGSTQIYLFSHTRGEYTSLNVVINLQANEHETKFEVTFQCTHLPLKTTMWHLDSISCVYRTVFCRRSASVFTSRRIRFLIIYICSLERMFWMSVNIELMENLNWPLTHCNATPCHIAHKQPNNAMTNWNIIFFPPYDISTK